MLERLVEELSRRIPLERDDPARPRAAVALLLVPDPDRLLVIRRADRAGDPWSGQLALPGGRWHADDTDLMATAIRETEEETGIHLDRAWCRAQLDDLVPTNAALPPIMVRPFVFLLSEAIAPGLSNEVAHAAWLPLANLMAEGVYRPTTIEVRGTARTVEGYHLPEGFLWGMTERILTPVLAAWRALG
ncbi:MAG: CoA pyrophosphatase [Gemmatimonadota bacterium]